MGSVMARLKDLQPGVRVIAPNQKRGGMYAGVIVDNLNTMYYIHFDCGTYDFVFKEQHIELEK